MPHVKDKDERWAVALLEQIVARARKDRDALSGSVVKRVKDARSILKKRLKNRCGRGRHEP